MQWIGLNWYPVESTPLHTIGYQSIVRCHAGQNAKGPGGFHYNPGNPTHHPEVRTMPKCVACGAELELPVRTPHTVYVKTLYRIGGQDYCRHHTSGPPWPPASSPRSSPAPGRWRRLIGERPRPNMTSTASAELVYAITLHRYGGR